MQEGLSEKADAFPYRACRRDQRELGVGRSTSGLNSRGQIVVATLDEAVHERSHPKITCLDIGPAFISKELDLPAAVHNVRFDFSRPGKPTDSAFIESLNESSEVSAGIPTGS